MGSTIQENQARSRSLDGLGRLVGSWTTQATHPAFPGVVVHGTVEAEWLEGEQFVVHRSRTDHPDFPDALAVFGSTDEDRVDGEEATTAPSDVKLTLHYFDSRGVFRVYDVEVDDRTIRYHREAPGFSQRMTGTFSQDGRTLECHSQLREDDVHWKDDLQITYTRIS